MKDTTPEPKNRAQGWKAVGPGLERWWQGMQWSETYRTTGAEHGGTTTLTAGITFDIVAQQHNIAVSRSRGTHHPGA